MASEILSMRLTTWLVVKMVENTQKRVSFYNLLVFINASFLNGVHPRVSLTLKSIFLTKNNNKSVIVIRCFFARKFKQIRLFYIFRHCVTFKFYSNQVLTKNVLQSLELKFELVVSLVWNAQCIIWISLKIGSVLTCLFSSNWIFAAIFFF